MHSILICGGTEKDRKDKVLGILKRKRLTQDADTKILERGEKFTIGIAQIRELEKFLARKPFAAPQKIGIVLEAENLTVAAQNALLKTLEEPPAHSLIILTIREPFQLLPTVVSRCEVLDLGAKPELEFEDKKTQKTAEDFLTLINKDQGERLLWVESHKAELTQKREVLKILEIWSVTGRDLLVVKEGRPNLILNRKLKSKYKATSRRLDREKIAENLGKLEYLRQTLGKTNVNPRLTLEVFLLGI